jgi:tRNA G18 (ribose-2'-O)-methylase SpoU
MEATLTQTAAATIAAESLKARAGRFGVLATVNVKDLAETLAELADEHDGNVFAASAALQNMDAAEQLETLGLDEDDEKSYIAARYGMAA